MPRAVPTHSLGVVAKALSRFLTDICLIEQRAPGTGQYGEQINRWVIIATKVPCRLIDTTKRVRPMSGLIGDALSIKDNYRLIVGPLTALGLGMRVTVNGLRYDIASLQEADTDSVANVAYITRERGDQP